MLRRDKEMDSEAATDATMNHRSAIHASRSTRAFVALLAFGALCVSAVSTPVLAQSTDYARFASFSNGAGGQLVHGQHEVFISQPNGKLNVWVEDMRVKVRGGYVVLNRRWDGNKWLIAPAWNSLSFLFDTDLYTGDTGFATTGSGTGSGSVSSLAIRGAPEPPSPSEVYGGTSIPGDRATPDFDGILLAIGRPSAWFQIDSSGTAYPAFGAPRYVLRALWEGGAPPQPVVPKVIASTSGGGGGGGNNAIGQRQRTWPDGLIGWRWEDKSGDWIEFSRDGAIQRYGGRNNVTVSFDYAGGSRPARVLDANGEPVLLFVYAGDQLVEVRDVPRAGENLPARSVKYEYGTKGSIAKVTDVAGNFVTYGYDAGGKLTRITDQENHTRRFEFGPTNRIAKFIDADGAETDYRHDYDRLKKLFYVRIDHPLTEAGRMVEERWIDTEGHVVRRDLNGRTMSVLARQNRQDLRTDERGQQIRSEHDEYDNATRTVWPDGTGTSARYSPRHLGPVEEIDERGIRATYTYDAKGNPTQRIEASGLPEQRSTEWTYDSFGQVLTETVKGGGVTLPNGSTVSPQDATTRYEYDSYGNRIAVTDAEGNVTRLTYNRLGQVTETLDARGNRWPVSFDARGLLLTAANPLNQSTSQTSSRRGEPLTRTDAMNRTWRYEYNAKGRLTKTTDPLGNSSTTTYDALGQITQVTDFAGEVARRVTYDRDGRPLATEDALGNKIEFVYGDPAATGSGNAGDLPIAINYPTFTQSTSYDSRGRPRTITITPKPAFNLNNTPALVTRYGFDAAGNRTEVTDAAGNVTRYSFDALRRITSVTDATNGVTRTAFDQRNKVLAVQDANGNQHVTQFDRLGRKTKETQPGGEAWTWTYDAVSNLATQTDAKNQTATFDYDAADRRIRTVIAGRTVTYDYSSTGHLVGYSDGTASGSITLDELQRKTAETVTYAASGSGLTATPAITQTYRYRYGAQGTKSALVLPDGTEATYTHDANRQLTGIQLPQGAIGTTYKNAYTSIETLYPGGTRSSTQLDALLRVVGIDLKGPTQQTLMSYGYTFDAADNITSQRTQRGTNSFGYDALYRLTQASYGNGLPADAFTYDKVHNRLTDQTQPGTWSYNTNNQLINQGAASAGSTWSYDANGQATQKQPRSGPPTPANPNRTYGYNPENLLAEVQDEGVTIARYTYDPFGRRIKKEVTSAGNTTITFFLYADEGLLAELDAQGRITTQYGFAPDGMWGTHPMYRLDKDATSGTNTLSMYHTDHLSTPQMITNPQGQILWSERQTAFGEMTVDPQSTITSNLRFPGQYFDAETQTHYNYFRDYEPRTGRYVQSDPIGIAGGLNTYAYVRNSPLSSFDPLGLEVACQPSAWPDVLALGATGLLLVSGIGAPVALAVGGLRLALIGGALYGGVSSAVAGKDPGSIVFDAAVSAAQAVPIARIANASFKAGTLAHGATRAGLWGVANASSQQLLNGEVDWGIVGSVVLGGGLLTFAPGMVANLPTLIGRALGIGAISGAVGNALTTPAKLIAPPPENPRRCLLRC